MTHGRQKIHHDHLAIVTRSQFSKAKRYVINTIHLLAILEIITEMLSFKIALNYIQYRKLGPFEWN